MARPASIFAAALLLCSLAMPVRADYDEGLRAFGNGDVEQALLEFRALARQGHAPAEFMLGVMYFNGVGVQQDPVIAAIYFRQAAAKGDAAAQLALGTIFIRGVGVGQNLVQALAWLTLAARDGPEDLRGEAETLRNATRLLMTDVQIRRALRFVEVWQPGRAGLVVSG